MTGLAFFCSCSISIVDSSCEENRSNDMCTLLAYLLLLIFLQVSINAFIVALTRSSSPTRLAALPLVVACVYTVLPICLPATGRVIWAALLGAHSLSFLFQYIDTALLSKWSAETNGPSVQAMDSSASNGIRNKTTQNQTLWHRIRFGYYAAVSTRNVGTPFEMKGVPRFSQDNPSYVPSKSRFLGKKALLLLSCYLILDLLTFASQLDQNPILYHDVRISWKNPENLSTEQLIVRSTSTLGFWISLYCIIQAYMGTVAFVSVALGLSEVKSWPPGFGPVSEAYTIRRFWG